MAVQKKRKKKKNSAFSNLVRVLCVLIALSLVLIVIFTGIVMYFNSPVQDAIIPFERDGIKVTENGECYIDVRRGESAGSVGLRLERTGVIRNRYFWNLLSRIEKEHIKTGTYKVEIPASQITIHRLLVSGKQILHRITIPEGVSLSKTARLLEEAGICSAGDFLASAVNPEIIGQYRIPNESMEGYLFPDTYLFPGEYPAEQVVKVMADTFFNRITLINPLVSEMSSNELNEKVIIASIVEREYRVSEEAPLMAGVFYNRIGINMALQSCATVVYIITEIQRRPHPSHLYNQDLEIRNPYNTYQVPGLPPGPICAPGITALSAAMFPEKTEYLYFRLTDAQYGRHYFSRTLDEHIRAGSFIIKPQS